MIKWKLELITTKDINEFVRVTEKYKEDLIVTNSTNTFRVSAKSLMGMLYTTEWGNDVYLVCDTEPVGLYNDLEKYLR